MTSTTLPDHDPYAPSNYLLIRSDDWAHLYPITGLDGLQGLLDLKRHCEGAYQSQEPLGDVWFVPANEGEPARVHVAGSATPYDEDDYATQTCTFYYESVSGRVDLCSISFRLDGRS